MKTTKDYKIVMLDASKKGKYTLVSQYVYGTSTCHTTYHTISGDAYAHYELFERAQFEIHDAAGSDKYHSLRKHHIEEADAFVLVYNLACSESSNSVKWIWEEIREVGNTDVPIIVMVIDQGNEDKERAVSIEAGDTLAIDLGCIHMEFTKELLVGEQAVFFKLAKELIKMIEKEETEEENV